MKIKLRLLALILSLTACKGTTGRSLEPGPQVSSLLLDNRGPPSFDDRTLDRVTFLTAHNAFANNGDNARFIAPNQDWGLTKQMEMGVRGFMLDVYSRNGQAVLCHMRCGLAGFFPWISLTDELRRFEDFMKKDRNAIITLHIEWTAGAKANEFEAAFNKFPDLKNMIFDPYQADVKNKGWPKVRDMIASNKRLLILSQSDSTRNMGVALDKEFTVENYWSTGTTGHDRNCRSRWDEISLDTDNTQAKAFRRLFVMNHFRDSPTILTAALDNTIGSLLARVTDDCLWPSRRIPNYVAIDFVNKGTGRETVDTLNRAVAIVFEHENWGGRAQLIVPGNQNFVGGNGHLEDNSMSSIEVFFQGTPIKFYEGRNQQNFLFELNETSGSIPANDNDTISSYRAD